MLDSVRRLFRPDAAETAPGVRPTTELAAAALLVEIARADHQVDDDEERMMAQLLRDTLSLDEEEVASLLELAHEHSRESVGLHPFTSIVHAHFSATEKVTLFECLWRVAYADGRVDKYEEHLLRRIAELLHVSHRDFIRTKLKVAAQITAT